MPTSQLNQSHIVLVSGNVVYMSKYEGGLLVMHLASDGISFHTKILNNVFLQCYIILGKLLQFSICYGFMVQFEYRVKADVAYFLKLITLNNLEL